MSQPGITRGLIGFVIGVIGGIIAIAVLRLVLGLMGALGPTFDVLPGSGALLFFGGFGGLFGWLWGLGSFSKYSTEHNGMELALEDKTPSPLERLREVVAKATPSIVAMTKPLIQPLGLALGVCVAVVVVIMGASLILNLLGSPMIMVTTENPTASAVTPSGSINLGGLIINKTVFFIILAVIVLGITGGLAILLAVTVNGVSQQVDEVKKLPADVEPPDSPLVRFTNWVFRLIEFFLKWVDDILEGAKHSVER